MKTNKYEIDMCNGSIMDKLISFALPLMLSGILQLMFNAVDIVVVGHFTGKQALAAVGSTSKPLADSGVFPPMVYHMIEIGEETGNMEDMLDKVAAYYDEEVESATEALLAAMEPLIIIVMAVIVVPIVLAIMMPMYSLYDSIGA